MTVECTCGGPATFVNFLLEPLDSLSYTRHANTHCQWPYLRDCPAMGQGQSMQGGPPGQPGQDKNKDAVSSLSTVSSFDIGCLLSLTLPETCPAMLLHVPTWVGQVTGTVSMSGSRARPANDDPEACEGVGGSVE